MGALHQVAVYTIADITQAAAKNSIEVDKSSIFLDDTFTIKRFDADGDLKNWTQRQVLYIPKSSVFKAWDLIIHTPPSSPDELHQILFIQISTETVRTHDSGGSGKFRMQNSLNNPMDPKKGISTFTTQKFNIFIDRDFNCVVF